jgi:hypothetical protein
MSGLLSALAEPFSKSQLLSTLLPVVVFVLLALVLVVPALPATLPVVQWVLSLDSQWRLAAVTLAVVLFAALLQNLNGPIIRFFEGYPWRDSWVGQWRTRVHRGRMMAARDQWRGLWTLLVDPAAQQHPDYAKVTDHWNDLARTLNGLYPDEPDAVLPTRFGNVVRSFESYPWRQYKIRAITVFPRLAALLDESYSSSIDDAKASVDFMLNTSLLCGALAVLIAVTHLAFPVRLATAGVLVPLACELAVLAGLAYFFYLEAIPRASAWGMTVKGAFDLFRWRLLEALGYQERPESLEQEQALWEGISNRLMVSNLNPDPLPPYKQLKVAETGVRTASTEVEVAVLRGARRPAAGCLEVTIQVQNLDRACPATGVVVTDTVPAGWAYEWGSAVGSHGSVDVRGTNPYCFRIADLAGGEAACVTYRAVPTTT